MVHSNSHSISPDSQNKRRLALVLSFSSLYLIAEVTGRILTKSLALLAYAVNTINDIGGLALAPIAIKLAERLSNSRRT